MAESSGTSGNPSSKENEELNYHYATLLVKECTVELGWRDLSKDFVMDVGCGPDFNCCNVILKEFPDVKYLVAIDKNESVFDDIKIKSNKIGWFVGDMLKRETLSHFEGKIGKVISANTIHRIPNKKLFFENSHHMLKPGGEVAFLFIVDSCYHNFMVALLKVEKFKSMYKGPFNPNMYSEGRRSQYYKQMLEEIGFRNVVAKEIEKKYPHPSDEEWKDSLYEGYKNVFDIPPERVDEIKEEAFQIYVSRIERYEGNPCYSVLLLCLFGLKKKVETTVL